MRKILDGTSLLTLAKSEEENYTVANAPFDISKTISNITASMGIVAREKNIALSCHLIQNMIVNSDEEIVKTVFSVLLDNAIKYSDMNGTVKIFLKKTKRKVLCSVQNSGNPIAKEDLHKIFDRFYRSDQSRTADNAGYGLGLAIAKQSVERLGGSISANSTSDGVTTFTFTL